MTSVPPDWRPSRHGGDGWVECGCGARHWGLHGAAGLLLARGRRDADGAAAVVLQHRALWSHHGGTWGIPGGALAPHETPPAAAVREAGEEAGVPGELVRIWATSVLHHPDWAYTTVVAEATRDFAPRPTDAESLDVAWVPVADVPQRPLLPAFADRWPLVATMLGRRSVLVVDGANVVGSRPDGWWRDRAGAARRLRDALVTNLARGLPAPLLGLPGDRWWPDVLLVLEGEARRADVGPDAPDGPTPGVLPHVVVARAPGSGDDEIVARVAALRRGYTDVAVATADRGLGARVSPLGAALVRPGALREALA